MLAVEQSNDGWSSWKDVLTLVGVIITAIVSVFTVRLSRKTTLETSESTAYARADKITEQAFSRLQREIDGLRTESQRLEERHQRELVQCDGRINDLEARLGRSERRVEQLVQVIRAADLPVPPATA